MKIMRKILLLFTIALVLPSFAACKKKSDNTNDVNNEGSGSSVEHTCSFSEWVTVSEPNCSSNGLREKKCDCGETESEEILALGHDFSDGYFYFEGEAAYYRYECVRVGCDDFGTACATVTSTCLREPTCEDVGLYNNKWSAVVNGENVYFSEDYDAPALGHDFGDGDWVWSEDYTASYVLECKRDSTHSPSYTARVSVSGTSATCTMGGYQTYTATVTVGGAVYTDYKTVTFPKLGHDYSDGVWEWNGYDSATYTVACKNNSSHTKSASALAEHTVEGDVCEGGLKDVYTVSVTIDDTVYTDTKEITTEPKGHDYDAENAVWTWYAGGELVELSLTCLNDPSHTITVEADVSITVSTQPTCQGGGFGHGVAVAVVDGVEYTDECDIDLNPLEHELDYESAYWVWEGTASAMLYIPCTLGEGHLEEYYAEVTYSYLDPTCDTDGYEKYTATVELFIGTATDEKTEVLDATGHDYVVSEVEWIGDDYGAAKITLKCNNYDCFSEPSDIEFAENDVLIAATCTKDGLLLKTVTIEHEGKSYSASTECVASRSGHSFYAGSCNTCGIPVYSVDLEYEMLEDGSGYRVIGRGQCTDTVLSIPNMYEGLPVVEIGNSAFEGDTSITALYLSETITKVGQLSFADCTSLAFIDFSDAYATIEYRAFTRCYALTSLDIPANIYRVKDYAFSNCESIISLKVASPTIYDGTFYGLVRLRELELAEGVETICDYSFGDCHSLVSVTLPSTLTYITGKSFTSPKLVEVKNLSKIDIVPNLSSQEPFYANLRNVYTEDSGSSCLWIDETGCVMFEKDDYRYLLDYRGSSSDIVLPESCNGSSYTIYIYAFAYTDFGDGYLYIPSGVEIIHKYAFWFNDTIKIIEGGEGVKEIGMQAFYKCSELMSFTFGASLTGIYRSAFEGCSRLYDVINHSSINMVAGTVSEHYAAYYAISVVTDKEITKSAITITADGFAFYNRNAVRYLVGYYGTGDENVPGQLTLPENYLGLTYGIYKHAIRDIDGVYKILLTSGVSSISSEAFLIEAKEISFVSVYDPSTDSFAIISNLKRIEDEAFKWTKITEIYIPASLEYIGKNAFPETLTKAEFANPNGWYIETIGEVAVDPERLTDPEDAATWILDHTQNSIYKKTDNE